jgi:hypothetical protein
MAQNINTVLGVTPKKRGRPKGSGAAKGPIRKASEAAAKAEAMVGGAWAKTGPMAAPEPQRAPAFGANQPDVSTVCQWAKRIRLKTEEVDKVKLAMKAARGALRDERKLAQADGMVMGELDEAIEALRTEHVDLLAREERRRFYFAALGLPIVELGASVSETLTPGSDADRWFKRGDQAGRLGEKRDIPDGCPGEHVQDFLRGWEAGQDLLMRALPLTRGAYDPAASDAAEPVAEEEVPGIASRSASTLVLNEAAFIVGTDIMDANLKTMHALAVALVPMHERVIALFGTKRRPIKEPDDTMPGGFYIDTGEPDVPLSDAESASAAISDPMLLN